MMAPVRYTGLTRRLLMITFLFAATALQAQGDSTIVKIFDQNMIHFGSGSQFDTPDVKGEDSGRIIRRDIELPAYSGPVQITAHLLVYSTLQESGSGDPWDRAGSVFLSVPGMEHIELLKFITGFGGRSDLRQDVSDLAPLLAGMRTIRGFVDTWVSPGWKMSFELIYKPLPAGTNPQWAYGAYYNWGMTTPQVGPDKPKVAVNIPPEASQVWLTYYTSGHCTDGSGADEFVSKDNVISIDGVQVYRYQPWRSDCKNFRSRNPNSGRWGATWSSDLSRSGWCPGDIVYPVRLDLSSQLTPGAHDIRYAVENIRPADASGTGYWRVSSYLTGQGNLGLYKANRFTLSFAADKMHAVRTTTPVRIDLVDDTGLPVFMAAATIEIAADDDSLLFSIDGTSWSNPFLCPISHGSAQLWMKSNRAVSARVTARDISQQLMAPDPLAVTFYDYEVGPNEVNRALGATARADCECNRTTENAGKAIDGQLATKWCCNNGSPDWLEVTLPDSALLNYFIVRHAGAGKAPAGDPGASDGPSMNSSNFAIQLLNQAGVWQNAVSVTDNPGDASGSVSYHALPEAVRSKQVRLYLTKPDVSRIYEFEMYNRDATPVKLEDLVDGALPERMELLPAWPNPFNSATVISLFIPGISQVQVAVMNSRGQLVRQVLQGSLPRGMHSFNWQGTDAMGQAVASGIYYINVLATSQDGQRSIQVRPVTLVR